MFHTQEKRIKKLKFPVPTFRDDAWLGSGSYFWYYYDDAVFWGRTAKKKYGYYEVYEADIKSENILDTVFDEEYYSVWVKNIEKAIKSFLTKPERDKLSLKYINNFLKFKGVFKGVDGVMFQDISNDPEHWILDKFQYKKRIQLCVFNSSIITNFAFSFEGKCV